MSKSLLYRLFGLGKIPRRQRAALETEGVVLSEEGIRGSITYKNFRAPGKRILWRKRTFIGSLVLTEKSIFAIITVGFSKHLINVPFSDPRFERFQFTIQNKQCLCITFDASNSGQNQSGTLECRFFMPQAQLFLEKLNRKHSNQSLK